MCLTQTIPSVHVSELKTYIINKQCTTSSCLVHAVDADLPFPFANPIILMRPWWQDQMWINKHLEGLWMNPVFYFMQLTQDTTVHQQKHGFKSRTAWLSKNRAHGLLIACFTLEILHISCLFIRMMVAPVSLCRPHAVKLKIHSCGAARPQYAHRMRCNDLAWIDIAYKLSFWT